MIRGLPASIIAHAAVLGASYVSWPYLTSNRVYVPELEAVDVNFAEIGEITNIAPVIETEPEEPEAAIEEPEEDPPEDPVEEDIPEAEEDVADAESAAVEEDPEDVLPDFEPEKQEEEPEPEPEPEPEVPQRQRAQDNLDNLLNNFDSTFQSEIQTRREQPEPPPTPAEDPEKELKDEPRPVETQNQQGAGERNANIARIESILYSRIFPCWDGVADLPFPDRLNVRMNLQLNLNGTIADLRLVEPSRRPVGNSPMGTAVDRALRAVRKCAPYNLPQDEYEDWREGAVNLGPAFTPTNQR